MSELPDPFTAPESDLRDFPWMPIVVPQLTKSKAWSICKRRPELAFYMLNLWMASWHSVPAASLEDDDDVLCDAALCDPKKWPSIRELVMRNWVKCADGLLYHPVVAKEARSAWGSKLAQRDRTAAATQARMAKKKKAANGEDGGSGGGDENVTSNVTKNDTFNATTNATDTPRSPPDQTRPDQTNILSSLRSERPPPGKSRRDDHAPEKRATRLPPDWEPTEADREFALGLGLPVARTLAVFRDYWLSASGQNARKHDWSATWRNWCRREGGNGSSSAPAVSPKPKPPAGAGHWAEQQRQIVELFGQDAIPPSRPVWEGAADFDLDPEDPHVH